MRLQGIVLPCIEQPAPQRINRSKLRMLQQMAQERARGLMDPPEHLDTLLDAICVTVDRPAVEAQAALQASAGGDVSRIRSALGVDDVIASYDIPKLLDEYFDGSRQWLYDEVRVAWWTSRHA